ncbi:hypothetical protein GGTG_12350 [Gaeumannomyces tritici R3-111a-1]|uniref:Uncharacterized protein n=1 Tax=Gaeumannomyces tritici (strain R3-111a-1) TaxID=644352 RepID=J3PFS5_GAET3|nr:hypothetical protein GGTG_12350 [Gaeumannomyces tritici R3-111a-1]EJT70177.1 hypothetical protein GGTG_12350 [Gaeumannomyces tritici R3-111a-1]
MASVVSAAVAVDVGQGSGIQTVVWIPRVSEIFVEPHTALGSTAPAAAEQGSGIQNVVWMPRVSEILVEPQTGSEGELEAAAVEISWLCMAASRMPSKVMGALVVVEVVLLLLGLRFGNIEVGYGRADSSKVGVGNVTSRLVVVRVLSDQVVPVKSYGVCGVDGEVVELVSSLHGTGTATVVCVRTTVWSHIGVPGKLLIVLVRASRRAAVADAAGVGVTGGSAIGLVSEDPTLERARTAAAQTGARAAIENWRHWVIRSPSFVCCPES